MRCFPRKFAASLVVLTSAITMSFSNQASAQVFGGINFPDGVSSFADSVITYDCNFGGGQCPAAAFQDPTLALGSPDLDDPVDHFVSLGTFGLLEVAFVDNRLTNSGDALDDLHIFELGSDVEDTLVAVRPTAATALILGASFDANADGFYEVGSVSGGISSVDIDSFFAGYASGVLVFDAVQLIDEFGQTGPTFGTHGADITAVGAISSEPIPDPGDFNGDLLVNGADFLKWQREDGTSSGLLEWEANYGNDYALAAATASVPEPSSLALFAAGLLGMGYRRQKQA